MAVYVNNDKMLEAYKTWYNEYLVSKQQDLPRPEIPRVLAESIILICTKLANRHNFNNYSYRDDMTSDAILECIKYFHCFNPERSVSIFSYFTRVAFLAFVNRINKERKQSYVKGMIVQKMDISEFIDNGSDYGSDNNDVENTLDTIRSDYFGIDTSVYKNHLDRKKKKKTEPVELVA